MTIMPISRQHRNHSVVEYSISVCDHDWSTAGVGRVSAQHLVRTDSRDQKMDAFLVSRGSVAHQSAATAVSADDTADFVTSSVTDNIVSLVRH